MRIGRLADTAKRLIDKRGGQEALKQDAQELRRIAQSKGTLKDKAKQAADALKDPGARDQTRGPEESAPPAPPPRR